MENKNLKSIFLTSDQIEILYNNNELGEDERDEEVPGFEGWTIDCDTDTGEYDGEKGSMIDYEIYLYDAEGNFMGSAIGGYYNGVSGHQFEDLTFELEEPEPLEPKTPLSMFNKFLDNLVHENLTLEDKISKVKNYIETI